MDVCLNFFVTHLHHSQKNSFIVLTNFFKFFSSFIDTRGNNSYKRRNNSKPELYTYKTRSSNFDSIVRNCRSSNLTISVRKIFIES